ncbi:MAG TPA: sulfite exporter TauE/SafE family protein [Acidobacteriaceae bacterium]|nr:sulfite exporter TauE/SafE family protein [Acidobacteriaceae bacterium]
MHTIRLAAAFMRPRILKSGSLRSLMGPIEFTLAVLFTSAFAGLLGALTGLGGGVVIVPALVLLFHIDLRYAIGASLISVIATSSGAAVSYVREGLSNVRIGMFLEVATTLGALVGAYLTTRVTTHAIGIIFGVTLLYSAWSSFRAKQDELEATPNALAEKLNLKGDYPTVHGPQSYTAHRVPAGFGIMFIAGVLSGLLGIGSGAVKVLAMDRAMKLPFKVSTTTRNFMIGVTAAASAGLYLGQGYIAPGLAAPVMLGVLAGSILGASLLVKIRVPILRAVFAVVIVALGIEMIYSGATGRL